MAIDSDRIDKPVRKLRGFLKKSPKRPSADQIHDLRTSARRFETSLDAFDPRYAKKRLFRDLSEVRKRAGTIRDMDVLVAKLLTINLNGEQDCMVRLVESLGAERMKHVKKLRASIARIGPRLRRQLKRSASRIENDLEQAQEHEGNSGSDLATEAMARALRLTVKLKYPVRLDRKNLHAYRLKVKELGYILQLAESGDQQDFVKRLGEVKDAIGEWHDWETLTSIASEVLDHGRKCKLAPKLRAISEKHYSKALSMTKHMRTVFLGSNPSRQTKARLAKVQVITRPVLNATSAISA